MKYFHFLSRGLGVPCSLFNFGTVSVAVAPLELFV